MARRITRTLLAFAGAVLLSSAAYAILPILDAQRRPHAIITLGGPRERFDLPQIEALLPRIRAILAPLENHARLFPAPPFLVDS